MHRFAPRPALAATLLTLALVGCGGSGSGQPDTTPSTPMAPQEAVSRVGDVTIRASVVQTSTLPETVARQYGIVRNERLVMLLVGVRQGPEAQETAVPAQVTATAIDLRGRRQDIAMRELRAGELLDYVGTTEIDLPDTVRFELTVVRAGGAQSTMQFSREFFPR